MNKLNISKQYHNDIFYPSSKDDIDSMINDIKSDDKKINVNGLLLPHAGYNFILPLLVEAFSQVEDTFDNVIILGAPHMPILEGNSPYNIFVPSFDGSDTPFGPLLFNTDIINSFAKNEMKRDSYFEEEPEFEIMYPLIKKYLPSTKVIPICCSINNSKQSKDLSTILNKIYLKNQNNLIIVTSNMNSLKKANFAYKDALFFKTALEEGNYLLNQDSRKQVTACGNGILDAIKKTKALKDKFWSLTNFERDGVLSTTLDLLDNKAKIVYHGLGILK